MSNGPMNPECSGKKNNKRERKNMKLKSKYLCMENINRKDEIRFTLKLAFRSRLTDIECHIINKAHQICVHINKTYKYTQPFDPKRRRISNE